MAPSADGQARALSPVRASGYERDDQDGDDVGDLDHRVDCRAGRVLEGIADGVSRDRRRVSVRALAAERAVLDQLLCVVPRAAACGHQDREEEADDDHTDQQTTERLLVYQ